MFFEFNIQNSNEEDTILSLDIEHKAKPAFLTFIMAGKMRKLARDILLGYKHYAETSEIRVPTKDLKSRYKAQLQAEVQYG